MNLPGLTLWLVVSSLHRIVPPQEEYLWDTSACFYSFILSFGTWHLLSRTPFGTSNTFFIYSFSNRTCMAIRMTALIKWSVPREWGPILILFLPHTMLSAQWVFSVWWISELKVSGEIKARGPFPRQKLSKPPLQLCLLSAAILIHCHLLSVFCSLLIVCFFYLPFWSYFLFLLWPKFNKKSW